MVSRVGADEKSMVILIGFCGRISFEAWMEHSTVPIKSIFKIWSCLHFL